MNFKNKFVITHKTIFNNNRKSRVIYGVNTNKVQG